MKVQRVYIDTSVIGGCFDEEFAPWSNGLMKDFRLGNFKPVISDVISSEIEPAPREVREKYDELRGYDAEFVEVTDEALSLADVYQNRQIVSPNYYDDSLHVAVATVYEADMVVSWNFKHIVHFEKIRKFNAVNQELGYKQIEIRSPREVTNNGPEEKDV
jgi:predicted nucleic acid-binding protein